LLYLTISEGDDPDNLADAAIVIGALLILLLDLKQLGRGWFRG